MGFVMGSEEWWDGFWMGVELLRYAFFGTLAGTCGGAGMAKKID